MAKDFSLDRVAVGVLVGLVFGLWPPVLLGTLWKLGVLDPARMSLVNAAVALGTAFVAVLAPWQALGQLRGALGIRIGEHGIADRRTEIAWSEVTALERPTFGTLVVRAGTKSITLQTYLFHGRDRLEQFIAERAPGLG